MHTFNTSGYGPFYGPMKAVGIPCTVRGTFQSVTHATLRDVADMFYFVIGFVRGLETF
jgi:hypothetical protein